MPQTETTDSADTPRSGDLIVCRCENVTRETLRAALRRADIETVNQAKKLTRAGMGACQGRTCARALERLLVEEGGRPAGTEPYLSRPPVRPLPVAALAAVADRFATPTGPVSVAMTRGAGPEASREDGEEGRRA